MQRSDNRTRELVQREVPHGQANVTEMAWKRGCQAPNTADGSTVHTNLLIFSPSIHLLWDRTAGT